MKNPNSAPLVLTLGLGLALGTASAAATLLLPSRAEACGGCFAPSATVTVVTAHRMAVSVGATQTTLWDQIEYAGDPRDFVWVLPIRGEVLVELADNAFFEALDDTTRVQLQGTFPPVQTFCPDPCWGPSAGSGGFADGGAAADGSSVTVYGEAVVGPYETATIGSEDPEALVRWLRDNGYAVPDSILPTIAHYVEGGLNFAVLRLAPNAGVSQMQPVRVTTPGSMPIFPLRMVAAGVEGKVGLELYVIGEGRYGSANFAVGEIDRSALAYDWSTGRFNYGDVFDATLAELGGRAWVAEYAQPYERWQWAASYVSYDESGELRSAMPDFEIALTGLAAPYLTKLRTDLLASFLDEDLVLEASLDGDVDNLVLVDRELNRPAPVSCPTTCDDPSFGGGGSGIPGAPGFMRRSGGGGGLCSVQPGASSSGLVAAGFFALGLGLVLLRRRRR